MSGQSVCGVDACASDQHVGNDNRTKGGCRARDFSLVRLTRKLAP